MNDYGLVAAYCLDGQGGGEQLDWQAVQHWQPADGLLWVHLQRDTTEAKQWLYEQSGLDVLVADALLAEETRPRCENMNAGVLLLLRGVNHNPGANPEDMVSIRLWVEEHRIISLRLRPLLSITDLREKIQQREGPRNSGEFIVQLADRLLARMGTVITDVDDEVDRIQEQILEAESHQLRTELSQLRRQIIALRRYLAPQRDSIARLATLRSPWLDEHRAMEIREQADRVTRYVEDLDAARERAAVTQEELTNRLAEQMNSRMYVMSVAAGIFLPLGFLTGLLGINVGGIPLADNPWGFFEVSGILIVIAALQLLFFRWRRWL
jgi:zinc transporter